MSILLEKEMQCGLLGEKLSHSFSPEIHAQLADYSYKLIEVPRDKVADFMIRRNFNAINVTIPYKQTVMPFCETISEEAKRIGSVNTIVKDCDGKLHGYNTDYYGFAYMAKKAGIDFAGKKVLILGSGGTSKTVRTVVLDAQASDVIIVSRKGENNYTNLRLHKDAEILINATPVGMYPNTEKSPIDLNDFPKCSGVLDVIYNPLKTRLLQQGSALNLKYSNGLRMLVAQAKVASEYFLGRPLPDEKIEAVFAKMNRDAANIVLIGMPGCGKSTIGKALAAQKHRVFVDTDELIVKRAGKSIPEIFAESGEETFRRLEEAAIAECSREKGQIIATGGGAVLRERNRLNLQQNGILFYLQRHLKELQIAHGRPLAQDHAAVAKLLQQREKRYLFCADVVIQNKGLIKDVVEDIRNSFCSLEN